MKLEQHEKDIADWQAYWDEYYADRGVPETDFLRQARESIFVNCVADISRDQPSGISVSFEVMNRADLRLNANTRLLHGIHAPDDVAKLPPHRREWLIIALKAAQTIVSMALKNGQVSRRRIPELTRSTKQTSNMVRWSPGA